MPDARCPMYYGTTALKSFDLFSYILILCKVPLFYNYSNKLILIVFYIFLNSPLTAQYCTNYSTTINKQIVTVCGNNCTNIKLTLPHIKNTGDYKVKTKAYTPFPFVTNVGFEIPTIYLEAFTEVINLPFKFCFYDSIYNKLVANCYSVISFDTTNASIPPTYCGSGFQNLPLPNIIGVQCSGNNYSPKASIYTAHSGFDPRTGGLYPSPPNRKIEFRTEGTAPCRRFIVSYYKLGTFGTYADANCSADSSKSIFQTVLYESTGIIEMYIEKFVCPPIYSSGGKSTLGLQNWNRDKAICAPGKNAQVWTAVKEAYQFIPSAEASRYISSSIYSINGNFIANADTTSNSDGTFNLNYSNICTGATDTTKLLVRTSFKTNPNNDTITYQDTVLLVKKAGIAATLIAPISCSGDTSKTLTVNATGDNFTYALNGGLPQTTNTFTNVPNGLNQIVLNGVNSGCTATFISFIGTVGLPIISIKDTAICIGSAIPLTTTSTALSISWQPTTGLTNANILNPIATPTISTQYIVTGTSGNCVAKDTVNITILPNPQVIAGTNLTVLSGADAQLNGTVIGATNYSWSPSTYLSNPTILNPVVLKPTVSTLYKLTATTTNGCMASNDVQVTIIPSCINIKEAFSPNGDGINDEWKVYNSFNCLSKVAVQVVNRYGGIVYENANYTNNWNGTYKGKNIADGTYYYNITYSLITGRNYNVVGNITILR